jgi:hypothetical protein
LARHDDWHRRELDLHHAAEQHLRDVLRHPWCEVRTVNREHLAVFVRVLDDRLVPIGGAVFAVLARNVDLACGCAGTGHECPTIRFVLKSASVIGSAPSSPPVAERERRAHRKARRRRRRARWRHSGRDRGGRSNTGGTTDRRRRDKDDFAAPTTRARLKWPSPVRGAGSHRTRVGPGSELPGRVSI